MIRLSLTAALCLSLLPGALAAQDPAKRIEAAESRAAAAGVPVSLLESRVAEGRAKGVPLERIAAVVERRATSLIAARAAMESGAPRLRPADLDAGADAVEAGIDGATLRSVLAAAKEEDRSVAIAVLTYLHGERGVPVGEALKRVTEALKKGPAALRDLPARAGNPGHEQEPGRAKAPKDELGKGAAGPPEALPAPGKKPGAGKPEDGGKPGKGKPKGHG